MNPIICTVDVVLLTIKDECLMVAVHERENEPFKGALALPGGYVHTDEDGNAFDAAMRVIKSNNSI